MGTTPKAWLLGSLIEHESCIGLKHSRCWSPTSRLKSAREEGAGFFQITRAYTSTGKLRFDALQELKSKYRSELQELSWLNIYQRPDLQIRAGILKMRENVKYYQPYAKTTDDMLAFADAAYNGGIGGLDRERRACQLSSWCQPDQWFNHVEKMCLKSKTALYGTRSACDINRHHVKDVLLIRSNKYKRYF